MGLFFIQSLRFIVFFKKRSIKNDITTFYVIIMFKIVKNRFEINKRNIISNELYITSQKHPITYVYNSSAWKKQSYNTHQTCKTKTNALP